MRAVEHWDDLLLTTWRECSDERAVLSVYPNGFQQPCRLQTSTLPVMAAASFDAYGILKLRGISRFQLPEEQPERPIPGAFIAAGFLFGPGSIVSDVPYDPDLYFYGEEIAMSARLWTSGFKHLRAKSSSTFSSLQVERHNSRKFSHALGRSQQLAQVQPSRTQTRTHTAK